MEVMNASIIVARPADAGCMATRVAVSNPSTIRSTASRRPASTELCGRRAAQGAEPLADRAPPRAAVAAHVDQADACDEASLDPAGTDRGRFGIECNGDGGAPGRAGVGPGDARRCVRPCTSVLPPHPRLPQANTRGASTKRESLAAWRQDPSSRRAHLLEWQLR
jgi:hypothetical protein